LKNPDFFWRARYAGCAESCPELAFAAIQLPIPPGPAVRTTTRVSPGRGWRRPAREVQSSSRRSRDELACSGQHTARHVSGVIDLSPGAVQSTQAQSRTMAFGGKSGRSLSPGDSLFRVADRFRLFRSPLAAGDGRDARAQKPDFRFPEDPILPVCRFPFGPGQHRFEKKQPWPGGPQQGEKGRRWVSQCVRRFFGVGVQMSGNELAVL
jgi:hypothetical protein